MSCQRRIIDIEKSQAERWQKSSRKEVILECKKNYIILVLNCILKNSKRTISVSVIMRRGRNNDIKKD